MLGLVAICTFTAFSPVAGENLLTNPSFEELTPDGRPRAWSSFVQPQSGAFAEVDPFSFGGTRAVMLHIPEPYKREPANNWSQVVVGDFGDKTLEFSGYVRTEAAGQAALWLQCFRQGPTEVVAAQTSALEMPISGTSDWERLSVRVLAPESTDFVVVRCVLKGRGSAWFDEVRLDAVAEPGVELDPIEPAVEPPLTEAPPIGKELETLDLLQLSEALQKAVADLTSANAQILERLGKLQSEMEFSRRGVESIERDTQPVGPHPLVPHGYKVEGEQP